MQAAQQAFNTSDYTKSVQLYQAFIESNNQLNSKQLRNAILNLASVCITSYEYVKCMNNCQKYVKTVEKQNIQESIKQVPKVEAWIMYGKCVIKLKKIMTHQQHTFMDQGISLYPYHKTLDQVKKAVNQVQITEDEDQYMDRIFEKLLQNPKLRNLLSEQSFLTKVQMIIRNPSLAGALVKNDPRLQQVTQTILMAQQEQQTIKQ